MAASLVIFIIELIEKKMRQLKHKTDVLHQMIKLVNLFAGTIPTGMMIMVMIAIWKQTLRIS